MDSLAEKKKKLDMLSDKFNKEKGQIIIGRLAHNEELKEKLKVTFIETPSFKVNEALGGGWPKGRSTIIVGNEDSGKTFELLETIGNNMQKDPNFFAGWLESEKSLSMQDFEMFNIDPERLFYHEISRDGAAEEALNAVESILLTGVIDMFVVNSLKCLVPAEELHGAMEKQQIGLQARLNSKMMRKLTPIIAEQNVAFIMVQHLMTEIGKMFGDPLQIAGGRAIRYGASLIVDYRRLSIGKEDPITKEEGVKIGVTVRKNHVITNKYPYVKTAYYGIFGVGTEKYLELMDIAIKQGILIKSGAFIKIPDENGDPLIIDGEKMQWQGVTKFRQYCIDNQDFFEELKSKINKKEIVESLSDNEINEIQEEQQLDEELSNQLNEDEDIIKKSKKKKSKKEN